MGRVLWHVTMSVDGFIAGPGDAMVGRSGRRTDRRYGVAGR
jgi:hypothetical protein